MYNYILYCSTVQLTSKDSSVRDEASAAILNLGIQCSDHEVVEKVTKHLFGVLNGILFIIIFKIYFWYILNL